MNEAETRAEHIDPALRAAGWGVIEGEVEAGKRHTGTDFNRIIRPGRAAEPWVLAAAAVVALCLGLVAAAGPAVGAMRTAPAKALRE